MKRVTLRLFVRNDDALPASQPVVDVACQLVFAADQMRRRRVVFVQFAGGGVVGAARHHFAHVLRLGVDGQRANHAAVRRPARRPGWSSRPPRHRARRPEPNRTRAAHAHVQLAQPVRVLSAYRYRNRNCINGVWII